MKLFKALFSYANLISDEFEFELEHFQQKCARFCAGLRERHITEFVDDQQFDGAELGLQFEQTAFVAGLHQLMDERHRVVSTQLRHLRL